MVKLVTVPWTVEVATVTPVVIGASMQIPIEHDVAVTTVVDRTEVTSVEVATELVSSTSELVTA